jgi:GDP-4-dehydro-6-deoxy-D-mannose reductase
VALQAFDGYGLPVIITRAFSHIGPGQSDGFVVSAIARQIAEAERDGGDQIELGNLEAERDFLDVDDVVRAYELASRHGCPGRTYNVASGVAVPIREVLAHLLTQAARPLRIYLDPERLRPVDVPRMVGDASRLRADTGWLPTSCWQDAATAALTHWRGVVG